jgi:hypothetical protein
MGPAESTELLAQSPVLVGLDKPIPLGGAVLADDAAGQPTCWSTRSAKPGGWSAASRPVARPAGPGSATVIAVFVGQAVGIWLWRRRARTAASQRERQPAA